MLQFRCRILARCVQQRTAFSRGICVFTPLKTKYSSHKTVIASNSERTPRWRYAADDVTEYVRAKVQNGRDSNTGCLTLHAADRISPEVFEKAMLILHRKVDSLQVCLRERNGTPWIADMSEQQIDFKVLENSTLEEGLKEAALAPYNLAEGPLWRARLLVCSEAEPCNVKHVKKAFPHQYHFIIDVNHCINDGVSLYNILQAIFNILDGLLDGAQTDDGPMGGKLRDGKEIRAIEEKIRENLSKQPLQLERLLKERSDWKARVPLITEAFGKPEESSPTTCSIEPMIVNKELLQTFAAKCQAHKVTLNSGFLGVMNAALVELVRESGLVRDSYMISTRHPVDLRRYMSDEQDPRIAAWGNHTLPMTQTMATPWDVRNEFWEYVTEYDTKFRKHLKNFGPVEEWVLGTILQPQKPALEHKVTYDYSFSNVYSPKLPPYGYGKHIQLTNFRIFIPVVNNDFGIRSGFSSLRDHAFFYLIYSSGYITGENAEKFSKKIISLLLNITENVN